MSQHVLKLFVQPNQTCLDVLRYLHKNIRDVNAMGAVVHVDKINVDEADDALLDACRKRGITRLPALITPDGKVLIGVKKVVGLFEDNLKGARQDERLDAYGATGDAEFGSNADLTSVYERELFSGRDKFGRLIPRKDKDEDSDEEGGDIQQRLAQYNRNVPRHRRPDGGRERDVDRRPSRRRDRDGSPDDNIASDESRSPSPTPRRRGDVRAPRLAATDDRGGDDMDNRMLAAWLDNTPGGD